MSTRQYIGARYTPKFSGTYDATQAYEALEVVDNGSGTTYIARKPVPPNIPLTNTEYWLVYGSSSGAILDLQDRMTDAESDITDLQSDVNVISSSILTMGGQLNTVANTANSAKNDVDAIKNREEVKERNILIFGNSYVDRGSANKLAACFDHSYKVTEGGIGFLTYTGHTRTFINLVTEAMANSEIPNESITDVIFVSAMGDTRGYCYDTSNAYSSLLTAISSCAALLRENCPNLNDISVALAETRDQAYFTDYTNTYNALWIIHRFFKQACMANGVNYIGWVSFNTLMQSAYLDTDHYHPSTDGVNAIGTMLKQAYFGNIEYVTFFSSKTNAPFGYTANSKATIMCSVSPDAVTINVRRVTLENGAVVTARSGSAIIYPDAAPVPPPAPMQDIDLYFPMIRPDNSNYIDSFSCTVTADTTGIAKFNLVANPNNTTCPTGLGACPRLEALTYQF